MDQIDLNKLRSAVEAAGLSQVGLAERAGLSRAQLNRLLSGIQDRANARSKTITALARALGLNSADLVVGGAAKSYLHWLALSHGTIDFRGIGLPRVQRQPVDAVFVEPLLERVPAYGHDAYRGDEIDDRCDPGATPGHARQGPSRAPASEMILSHDRLLILGEPGAGKTTLLSWMAHQASRSRLSSAGLPIYVCLGEFGRALETSGRTDLLSFVARSAADQSCPELEGLLREHMAGDRHCLVLLDGLDEVGVEDHRDQLVEAVADFVRQYPRNRFVVTSRPVGFDAIPWVSLGFSQTRIAPYGRPQLEEFVDKWAGILADIFGSSESEARASLERAIFSNPRVQSLASNALMLTILALLNESRGGALPRRRVDLYAKVADVFLETWERTRQSPDAMAGPLNVDLDGREFGWLLSDLALAMQESDRTLAARWWVAERMHDCLQNKMGFTADDAKDGADRILRYLTERTGLLVERGPDQFGFSHRTLQEYFAATGAIDAAEGSETRDVSDSLRDYFFNPRWSEVVRLVAAQVTPPVAESLVTCILDDPDPVGRFLRRGSLLVLRCLADGATVANRSLVSNVFESLVDLGRSKWLGVTLEALDALQAFEGTRLEDHARETIDAILETASAALDAGDYACLDQHVHWLSLFEQATRTLDDRFASEAARDVIVEIDGKAHSIVRLNTQLRIESPEAWLKSARTILRDDTQGSRLKDLLVHELRRHVATDPSARNVLRELVESATDPQLQAAGARALGVAAAADDVQLLLRVLESEERDIEVRAAAAWGLENAATSDPSICASLLRILNSDGPALLRGAAAHTLRKVARANAQVAATLLGLANQHDTAAELRLACAWALEGQLALNTDAACAFKTWLETKAASRLQRVAAQTLAHAMARGQLVWDHHVVERIEQVLMQLEDPCQHALEALQALATARELRRGLRLESVLRDALRPVAGCVELAFVFGSTARRRQTMDSDIDLMLIGEVRLRDLSTPLRQAEKTLGRRINPAIYTRDAFRQRYQAGDPFLIDVCRHEKIRVIGTELEDELRSMVAERLASAT